MTKTDMLAFRVEADVKAALKRGAKAQDRSLSSTVERILRAWLVEHGYLKAAAGAQTGKKAAARKPAT